MHRYAFVFGIFVFLFWCTPTFAQFTVGATDFALTPVPSLPKPSEEVTISIQDAGLNAIGAKVVWYINNKQQTQFANERVIKVTAGALGSKTTVAADLVRSDGSHVHAETVLLPTVVDLILEAQTYVPSFYEGRALPGRTSNLHAIAVVNDGGTLPDSAYTYRWTLGDDVVFGGPVLGKNSISFPMPLYSNDLTVEVINPSGKLVARNTMKLQDVPAELYFYEWSPLRGLYRKAVSDPFALIGDETTIYGEPYFVNAAPDNLNSTIQWQVGAHVVSGTTDAPRALTLDRSLLGFGKNVSLQILTNDLVPQQLESSFTVNTP